LTRGCPRYPTQLNCYFFQRIAALQSFTLRIRLRHTAPKIIAQLVTLHIHSNFMPSDCTNTVLGLSCLLSSSEKTRSWLAKEQLRCRSASLFISCQVQCCPLYHCLKSHYDVTLLLKVCILFHECALFVKVCIIFHAEVGF
jgi:hypothetical protein